MYKYKQSAHKSIDIPGALPPPTSDTLGPDSREVASPSVAAEPARSTQPGIVDSERDGSAQSQCRGLRGWLGAVRLDHRTCRRAVRGAVGLPRLPFGRTCRRPCRSFPGRGSSIACPAAWKDPWTFEACSCRPSLGLKAMEWLLSVDGKNVNLRKVMDRPKCNCRSANSM